MIEAMSTESVGRRLVAESISLTNIESSSSAAQYEGLSDANPRRSRWSEDLCRRVLVQECSDIPRNFNYADGVQFVYAKLVEWLGDDNLDLSIGVLYEFIEVDCDYTHDENAAFKRWQYDHLLRKDDLGNSYIPRMPYIVVGNPKPTERLVQWRSKHPGRYKKVHVDPPPHNETVPRPPFLGIGVRNRYQLENSWFVSSKTSGTRVLPPSSKIEHHKKIWDPKYGAGGTFVQTREIRPQDRTSRRKISGALNSAMSISSLHPEASPRSENQGALPLDRYVAELGSAPKWDFTPEGLIAGTSEQGMKGQYDARTRFKYSDKVYENDHAAKGLPDQDTAQGKVYYSNIKNMPLPSGISIPNGIFVRKHGLVPKDTQHLPENLHIGRMQSAEDLAITRGLQFLLPNDPPKVAGPLTPHIFKDRGLDFKWL